MKKTLFLLSLLTASLFNVANADDAAIKKSFKALNIAIEEIKSSPIAGLRMVLTDDGVFYVTDDGKYLMQTSIYDISGKQPVNATLNELISRVDNFKNEMLVYKADNEKHVVTVFTDPTCGYCIKLQNNMAQYNKEGITVRYLAYPRQGPDSVEAKTLQSVWCSADPKTAFAKATKGQKIPEAKCNVDITRHYSLGAQLGVRGTPAIIFKDTLIPGYIEPKQLREMLDDYNKSQN